VVRDHLKGLVTQARDDAASHDWSSDNASASATIPTPRARRRRPTVSITFTRIRPRTQPTQFWLLPRLGKGLTPALASDVRLWALAVEDGSWLPGRTSARPT